MMSECSIDDAMMFNFIVDPVNFPNVHNINRNIAIAIMCSEILEHADISQL